MSVLAWTASPSRSREIAEAVGGEARTFMYDFGPGPARVIARYLISALATGWYLLRRWPRAVIVMNPPVIPGLLAVLYRRLSGAPVVLDSHAGSFGLKGDDVSRRMLPVHAFLARRAVATLVAGEELAERVNAWGGHAIVLHEAPRPPLPAPPANRRPHVVFVCIFDPDEPVAAVVDAATRMPDVDFTITGDLRRRPRGLGEVAPDNVVWSGFVRGADYDALLASSDIIMALTTEPTSALRVGFEAVYGGRPLITSDWPFLQRLFPRAVFVGAASTSIEQGVRVALDHRDELFKHVPTERRRQLESWDAQLARLRAAIPESNLEEVAR